MGDSYNFQNSSETFERPNKKLFMFLGISIGIVIIAIIVVILSFLINPFSSNISETELLEGIAINLKENNSVEFKVGNEDHNIKINFVGLDFVDIIIQSETITATLSVGETKKFDLDNDGVYDIQVKLVNIENRKANLFVKKISEVICEENWNCTNWSNCVNETQIRICTDLNNCGTTQDKPEEIQNCVIVQANLTCLYQEGVICNQTEICDGIIINASDSDKCCDGECTLETQEIIDCEENWECFINASRNCEKAQFFYNSSIELFGMIFDARTYLELKGVEFGKCLYYERLEENRVRFNESLVQQMLEQNITQEQIDEQENNATQNVQQGIGLEYLCNFVSFSDLTSILERWEQGEFFFGASCELTAEGSVCVRTGDFEGIECFQSCYPGSNCESTYP